jgi:hypothetical protein
LSNEYMAFLLTRIIIEEGKKAESTNANWQTVLILLGRASRCVSEDGPTCTAQRGQPGTAFSLSQPHARSTGDCSQVLGLLELAVTPSEFPHIINNVEQSKIANIMLTIRGGCTTKIYNK